MAPDKGEKLEQVTEARRQSIQNIDVEGVNIENNCLVLPSQDPRPGSLQSVHSGNLDGALNDELVVAGKWWIIL